MSVILNLVELSHFLSEVRLQRGDPADAVCAMFAQWNDDVDLLDLSARWDIEQNCLQLIIFDEEGPRELALPVHVDEPIVDDEGLKAFGMREICSGVWTLTPSLNMRGVVHGFVTLYGVPSPAPWERLIVLATTF